MKSSFTASLVEPVEKSGARIEVLEALDVAIDDYVLPRNEGVIEYENGVVLVEA
jgi:hypothetical protein